MFERGNVVEKKKPEQIKKEAVRKKKQTEMDFQKLMNMANGWAKKAQDLQKRGDAQGAATAMHQCNEIRQHLEKSRQAGLEGLSQDEPDFDTPTEQMIQTARMNFGIDLKDPQVSKYLKALQAEKKEGTHVMKQHYDEPVAKINWTLIISIVVIIMSYRMWATGTSKVLREDVFGFGVVSEVVSESTIGSEGMAEGAEGAGI